MNTRSTLRPRRKGFTLLEIMIVVAIIGMLSTIAIPAFKKVTQASQNTQTAANFRIFRAAFEHFAMEWGDYPYDESEGVFPADMQGYLHEKQWEVTPGIGGKWDWEQDAVGIWAGISVTDPTADVEQLRKLDELMDDGNLSTGSLRQNGGRITYVIEEY